MESQITSFPNAFVGRVAEIAALDALLSGEARVVTLTGPGGIGKTRLAHEVSRAFASTDASRTTWFCDLTEARDRDAICVSVGSALQLAGYASIPSRDAVAFFGTALRDRGPSLIVLDNFERLVDLAASTVACWAAMAPDVRFLVTSRERLRLAGEHVFELSPLALPVPGDEPTKSEAVRLLLDRAGRSRLGRLLGGGDCASLAEIVRRVDGIPLAIELAATRLSTVDPAALLARLGRPLEVLAGGVRDGAARHRTLRATIEWSWALLDAAERSALAQCSVFRGGFDLAAADAVIDLGGFPNAPMVLDVVSALREKSLLWSRDEADGSMRFGMYATIHEFAAQQLASSGDETDAHARHARYFADLAGVRPEETVVLGRPEYVVRLARERENLAAASERASMAHPNERELRTDGVLALLALRALDCLQGSREEMLGRLERGLVIARELCDVRLEVRLLAARGALRLWSRAACDGLRDLEDAVMLASAAGDRRLEAWALHEFGRGSIANEKPNEGRAALTKASAILRDLGDSDFEPWVTLTLGAFLIERWEFTEARSILEGLLARLDDDRLALRAATLGNLGIVLTQMGARGAEAAFESAIGILRSVGSHWPMPWLLGALGGAHHVAGRLDESERCFGEALTQGHVGGGVRFLGVQLGFRALVRAERGQLATARDDLARSVALLEAGDDPRHRVVFQSFLAAIDATADDAEKASETLDRCESWFANPCDPMLIAVRLQRAHVDLARARAADATGDRAVASAFRDLARARIDGVRSLGESVVHETRLALRLLERRRDEVPGERRTRVKAFVVHRDGRWFEAPTGERVNCARKPMLCAVVATLAKARTDSPGVPVTSEALIAAVWPGQRLARKQALNRLRVGIATLRKLGLREVLQSIRGAYLFDPEVPIHPEPS